MSVAVNFYTASANRKAPPVCHHCEATSLKGQSFMTAPTVHPAKPIVKLASPDMMAGMDRSDRLCVQYRATLVAVLDLDDAIRMAQMVLRHAERCGIDVGTAAGDVANMPDEWLESEDFQPRF